MFFLKCCIAEEELTKDANNIWKKSVFYIIGLTYEMKSKMLARYFVSYLENEKEKKTTKQCELCIWWI